MPTPTVTLLSSDANDDDDDDFNRRFKLWLQDAVVAHVISRLADLERQASTQDAAAARSPSSPRKRRAAAEAKAILTAHANFETKKGALLDALDDAFPFLRAALLSSSSSAAATSGADKRVETAAGGAGDDDADGEKEEEAGVAAAAAYGVGMTFVVGTASTSGKKKKEKRKRTTQRPRLPTARKRRRRGTSKDADDEKESDGNDSDAEIDKENDEEKETSDEEEDSAFDDDRDGDGKGKKKPSTRKRLVRRPRKKKKKKSPEELRKKRQERDVARWAAHLERSRKFKEENGHLSIPPKHPELGVYAMNMRSNYRKRRAGEHLSESASQHLDDLEELGFDFAPRTPNKSRGKAVVSLVPFEHRLDQCRRFKEEHGHLYIPALHPELGNWAVQMRRRKRHIDEAQSEGKCGKKKLRKKSVQQLRALDDIGFEWKKKSGKAADKHSTITEDRINELEEVGVLFKKRDPFLIWDEMMESLREFKAEHGHCKVPRANKDLTKWIRWLRREYDSLQKGNESKFTQERIQALEELGLVLQRSSYRSWEGQLAKLRDYREATGNTEVPFAWKDDGLGRWVSEQRCQYRRYCDGDTSSMTPGRIKKLAELGFDWRLGNRVDFTPWDERYEELRAYQMEHGDTNIPRRWKANPSLGNWIHNQRKEYRLRERGEQSSMNPDRIRKLEELGFEWYIGPGAKRKSY